VENTRKEPWSIWKKLAVYPGYLAAAVFLLCVWIFISDTLWPPPANPADDSARMAAAFLAVIALVIYVAYLIVLYVIHALFSADN
jgi:hypothetical protein